MQGHDVLLNRYRIELSLAIVSALKVASGIADNHSDSVLMRYIDDTVFVPGSGIKGAFRSALERLLPHPDEPDNQINLSACSLFSIQGSIAADCNARLLAHKQENIEQGKPELDDQALFDWSVKNLCSVCQCFGSSAWASNLIIEDATPTKGRPGLRHGVAIDRDTGAASDGLKYDYEVYETSPQAVLPICITIENLTESDLKLLNLLIALLREGLQLGGKTSTGFGQVRLEKDQDPVVHGFTDVKQLMDRVNQGQEFMGPLKWSDLKPC